MLSNRQRLYSKKTNFNEEDEILINFTRMLQKGKTMNLQKSYVSSYSTQIQ